MAIFEMMRAEARKSWGQDVIYIEMTWVTEGYGINDLTKSFPIEDELTIWQKCGLVSTRI